MPNKISAIGRRKSSIASVHLSPGKGEFIVNAKPVTEYFPGVSARTRYLAPLTAVGATTKYAISVKVIGGGPTGQLDATVLGIARCLVQAKEANKPLLRQAGLLTRDPRERQRRMVGTGGKARRQKQSPKR